MRLQAFTKRYQVRYQVSTLECQPTSQCQLWSSPPSTSASRYILRRRTCIAMATLITRLLESQSKHSLQTRSRQQVAKRTPSPITLSSNTKHGRLGSRSNMLSTRHHHKRSRTLSPRFHCHTCSRTHKARNTLLRSNNRVKRRCLMHSIRRRSRNPCLSSHTTTRRSGKPTTTSTQMHTTRNIHRCAQVHHSHSRSRSHSLPSSSPYNLRAQPPTAISRLRHLSSPPRSTTTRRSGRPTTTNTRRSTTRSILRCAQEPFNSRNTISSRIRSSRSSIHSHSLSHSHSHCHSHSHSSSSSIILSARCRGCNSLRAGTLVLKTRVPLLPLNP